MITNPLDFKINADLVFLKLGISHSSLIRSTAKLNIGINFIGFLDHDLEQDHDTTISTNEVQPN